MKKTGILKALLASVLVCAAVGLPLGASAASVTPAQDQGQKIVTSANLRISSEVQRAENLYSTLSAAGFSGSSVQVQILCSDLSKETGNTVAQAEKKLDTLGVKYECSYYTVNIGGNEVVIDPFLCVA